MSGSSRLSIVSILFGAVLLGCGPAEKPWNVLLVTLDTTRADFLGCYGRESARTPHLDLLASEGVLFEQAVSAVPVTLPSHSTILTGTYPPGHGVRDNGLFQLPPSAVTLAEMLAAEGYRTGAAVGAYPLAAQFGIGQGFEFFDDQFGPDISDGEVPAGLFFEERKADTVNAALVPWLRDVKEEPFFAWVHYFDPHHPHNPPAPYDQLFRHDPYEGELAFTDQSFGSLRSMLEQWQVWDRTLVIIVGDHGEGRGEHGEDTHSLLAYDSTLRVPLIMRPPPGLLPAASPAGHRVDQRVGTVDLVPTVLDLLGFETDVTMHGRSLVPFLRGETDDASRSVYYAETLAPRLSQGLGELRVLYEGDQKYIHGPRSELFDLEADPKELGDLLAAEPETADHLRERLQRALGSFASSSATEAARDADPESRRKLEALGYVVGGGDIEVEEKLSSEGVAPHDRVRDNSLMSLCKQRLGQGDYLAARDLARQLAERAPGNLYYRSLLVMALLGLDDVQAAAEVAEEALGLAALNEGAFYDTVRRLFEAGEEERAKSLLESLIAERETGGARYLLGEMERELGHSDRALSELERALELEPGLAAARLSAAVLRSSIDPDDPLVVSHFERLLADHPLNGKYHYNFAVTLQRRGEPAEALRQLRRAVALRPGYCRAHSARLSLELAEGDPENIAEARADLTRYCAAGGGA